ncbi:hypothetical protein COEREDRAFT_12788 [Coemansia reversa NRRL 1564]|uniref:Uncharacterized protein n=1 Tax=Coemansia reversa (strain ATCC 12441 / NRRL 1564) TaxID=763665 RepID=A0A2G5B0C2_COERN|nr:hypothetical protein COEREDRAFT_12788 [Coemansia reversa NRRL 1564]|eukprot:PIA12472.1 hypothetical protein COEREDRAFT_12788 [Coemansia reversa NRRL 1564]
MEELTAAVSRLDRMMLVDQEMKPKPFGNMVKSKAVLGAVTEFKEVSTPVKVTRTASLSSVAAVVDSLVNTTTASKAARKCAKTRAQLSELKDIKALMKTLNVVASDAKTSEMANKSVALPKNKKPAASAGSGKGNA